MSTQTPAALTVPLAEAARLLGMSESNARLLEKQGKFPVRVSRVGSWLRVSRAEIDAYLHVAPPPPAPLDRDAIWLDAEIAAAESRLAALRRARPATTTTTPGADDAGLSSRAAASDRIADVAYPGVGTLDHTGPATVAGAARPATSASLGQGVEGGEKYRPRDEDEDGGPERPPQAGGSVHRGPRRADGDPRVRVAAGPHRVHGGGSLPTALPASRGAIIAKRRRSPAPTEDRLA